MDKEQWEANIKLWNHVANTDKAFVKQFKRVGGFEGTAINPMYTIRRATELWGPAGGFWGWTILNENYVNGAPLFVGGLNEGHEVIHTMLVEVYYPITFDHPLTGTRVGRVIHSGATMAVVKRSGTPPYLVSDEEHRKKSLTDAITKALSVLGFSSDIFMGGSGFIDNKYVNDTQTPGAPATTPSPQAQPAHQDTPFGRAVLAIANAQDIGDLTKIAHRISISENINQQQRAALEANLDARRKELQPQA